MTAEPPLVDTNILAYAFDTRDPGKREKAAALLTRCWRDKEQLSVSVQNLAEFCVIVTEKVARPLPRPVISRFIAAVASYDGWNVIGYDGGTILAAQIVSKRYSLHFWDALLVATMQEHGIATIYTEDAHFKKIPGLTAVNPFV